MNPFLTSWSWEKCCKPLIRAHWGAFMCEHAKTKSVFAWYLLCWCWLSCPLSRPCRGNSDVVIVWDHLKLIERVHTFHLDPTSLILDVCNSTFMCLDRLKLAKQRCKLTNDVPFIFSSLSLNDTSFRVFNLGFDKFQLSLYSSNCF